MANRIVPPPSSFFSKRAELKILFSVDASGALSPEVEMKPSEPISAYAVLQLLLACAVTVVQQMEKSAAGLVGGSGQNEGERGNGD